MFSVHVQTQWLARKPSATAWMAGAFAIAFALAAATLMILGVDGHAFVIALRVTGRWSFLLFWLAFTAGPIATLFGPSYRPLAQRSRAFGLAYAAAQLVHVSLLVWLYATSPKPPVPQSVLVFFGIGIVFTYLLAALSFTAVTRRLDPLLVGVLRTVGVYYIFYAFVRDLARNPFHEGALDLLAYLPFMALIGAAIVLRVAAWAKKALLFFEKKNQKTFAN